MSRKVKDDTFSYLQGHTLDPTSLSVQGHVVCVKKIFSLKVERILLWII